jgi:hypothetical protein
MNPNPPNKQPMMQKPSHFHPKKPKFLRPYKPRTETDAYMQQEFQRVDNVSSTIDYLLVSN